MRLVADLTLADPAFGLAVEEVLLDAVRTNGVETIRLWRNQRSIILGRSQSHAAEVDEARVSLLDIPVLRRMSGGGTVYHYPGNLNVSVFVRKRPELSVVSSVFEFFGNLLSDALAFLTDDLHAEDNGLYVGDRKVGGAAQAHRGSGLLYHTTLLVQPSFVPMDTLLLAMQPRYHASGIASRPRLTATLSEQAASPIEPQDLVTLIVDALALGLKTSAEAGSLTTDEQERAVELQTRKYGSPEWNRKL